MREFIILGVPSTFPCLMAALSSLPAAQEKQMEIIRVQKPGHTCDFMVDSLEQVVKLAERSRSAIQPPKDIMGGIKAHEAMGATFDAHAKNWPGV